MMLLEPLPPSPPVGKSIHGPHHHCDPNVPCILRFSDVGKWHHSFPKGTFCVCYTPPAIPCTTLSSCLVKPYSWSWTTKAGPNEGKSFQVPTIPIACKGNVPPSVKRVVSLFHSFKTHLSPEALDPETGRVLPIFMKLYQNNILIHFCAQLKTTSTPLYHGRPFPPGIVPAPPGPPPLAPSDINLCCEAVKLHAELAALKQQVNNLLSHHETSSIHLSSLTAPIVLPDSTSPVSSVSTTHSQSAHPSCPWLQNILDNPCCPLFLHAVDSGMIPLVCQQIPDNVSQVVMVTFSHNPPMYVGIDSNRDLILSDFCELDVITICIASSFGHQGGPSSPL